MTGSARPFGQLRGLAEVTPRRDSNPLPTGVNQSLYQMITDYLPAHPIASNIEGRIVEVRAGPKLLPLSRPQEEPLDGPLHSHSAKCPERI